MRLLFFDFVSNFGGAQRSTLELAQRLQSHCELEIVVANPACPEFLQELERSRIKHSVLLPGGEHVTLRGKGAGFAKFRHSVVTTVELIRVARKLRGFITRTRPDVAWSSSQKGFTLLALVSSGIPSVYFLRGDIKGIRGRPRFIQLLRQRATRVLVLSAGIRNRVATLGIPIDKIGIVPNAVDPTIIGAHAALPGTVHLPQAQRALRILLPATLVENKGQRTAVRALADLLKQGYDAVLYLAGDEPRAVRNGYRAELEEEARRLAVRDRVEFLGWRQDVPHIIANSTVVILPSEHEGVPRILLETIALKKPVVATPVGGIPDLIVEGQTGWLVDYGDAAALARGIVAAFESAKTSKDQEAGAFHDLIAQVTPEAQVRAALREFNMARASK